MSLLWGYNWVIMKEALRYCAPFDFSALRTFFGALVLFFLLLRSKRPLFPRNFHLTILLGLLSTTGGLGLSMWALEAGGTGKTAILVYTMPFWVLIMAWPFLSERIHGFEWLAVISAFSGLLLILGSDLKFGLKIGPGTNMHLSSSLLALASGICWAASAIVLKIMRKRDGFDLVSVSAWQMLIGAIPIGLIALSLDSQPIRWTPDLAGALAYNILFAGAVAQLLWFYSLCQLPAGIASIGTLATPVIGAIAASFQLGEAPSGLEAAGMVLIVSGLVFINLLDLKPIALCQYLGRTQGPSRCKEKNLPKKIARNHKNI